jgi:lipid-A-disaccharide synthase
MVVAYKVSPIETLARFVITASSIVLPNLILDERAIPEFIQEACRPETLCEALAPLVEGGAARNAQARALARLDALMALPEGDTPSGRAARIVIDAARSDLK